MENCHLPAIRLIPYSVHDAAYNMALDEWLLSLGEPVLRFYAWTKPTISFGKSNFREKGLNSELLNDPGLDKVKRLSGGKTVLHQHELTYSFACNADLFPFSIVESYRLISQPLADAFQTFGLDPEMKKTGKINSETSICFKEVSSYELTVGQKKLVGSAQFRRRRRFFQHGSILLDVDWKLWKALWQLPEESDILEKRVTSFKVETGQVPNIDELCGKIAESFSRHFECRVESKPPNAEEQQIINQFVEKYEWRGFD